MRFQVCFMLLVLQCTIADAERYEGDGYPAGSPGPGCCYGKDEKWCKENCRDGTCRDTNTVGEDDCPVAEETGKCMGPQGFHLEPRDWLMISLVLVIISIISCCSIALCYYKKCSCFSPPPTIQQTPQYGAQVEGDSVPRETEEHSKELTEDCAQSVPEDGPAESSKAQDSVNPTGEKFGQDFGQCAQRVEAGPRSLEEYVAQDLDTFWRWCLTPVDGLHRCSLLVKLFDYCGLTRRENKIVDKLKKLNTELHALGVFTTDRIEPHQRVPYEAFVQSRRLRDAVGSCNEAKFLWDQKRRGGRIDLGLGHTPLALWVLNVIGWDPKMLPIGVSTIAGFVADDGQKMAAEAKRRAEADETEANGQSREEVNS
eukprot:TRINITY_DN20034_c0_g1_i2.p1 TRINITY_DN20034_c0_g1~~TRINITY_DN20034_c0_g1_i2.p1  ORF type:complete len:370 (+),score=60.85 TRINITY_DN20034_c0_g1_i2:61-1170(+)